MSKFESSQKDESRAQSADSFEGYRKPSRAFNCSDSTQHILQIILLLKANDYIGKTESNTHTTFILF